MRDVRLRLKFTPNSGGACTDVVKLTVVRVDLDAANLLDEDEETAPGRLIAENDDFDENKGDPNVQRNPDDADASPVHADGSAIVTDDLVPLSRGMLPGGDGMFSGATVTLTKVGGAEVHLTSSDGGLNRIATVPLRSDGRGGYARYCQILWTVLFQAASILSPLTN
ncbi:MAG: hypothetical protein AMXMBFR22_33010 [Phycisphaerae bacterium]